MEKMARKFKSKTRRAKRRARMDPGKNSRAIDREIRKENGTLTISRGIHVVQTSRAEKRKSRGSDNAKAIDDSKDEKDKE
jgi:hypothetical protein